MNINILQVDSWRVKNVFLSNNGVSYEVLSTAMYKLLTQLQLDSRISFERYSTTKKCFGGVDKDIEVSVNDGIVSFKVRSFISSFTIGELGEPYCMIPVQRLKLLNKLQLLMVQRWSFVNLRISFYFRLIRSTIVSIFD